jgi:hypothetical protein
MSTVFISYRHENDAHVRRVREFGERLRFAGVQVSFDQFFLDENPGGPDEGWPEWSTRHATRSSKIIIIASPGWFRCFEGIEIPGSGLGAAAEGRVIAQRLYDAAGVNPIVRIALFDSADKREIPLSLKGYHCFDASRNIGPLVAWVNGSVESSESLLQSPGGGQQVRSSSLPREPILDRVQSLLALKEFAAAETLCRELLHRSPDDPGAHVFMTLSIMAGHPADRLSAAVLDRTDAHLRTAAEHGGVATAWAIWGVVRYDAYFAHNVAMGEPSLRRIAQELDQLGRANIDLGVFALVPRSHEAERFFHL